MSKDEIQKVTLGTNEALRVTADGEFVWHPEADAMIEEGDFTSSPAMRHILRALRKALAAPDLQAELDATNRQVEILSDALAESRREVAALKAVQEPVAFFDPQGKGFYWAKPTKITAPVTVDVEPLPLYTTPPAAQRQWVDPNEKSQKQFLPHIGEPVLFCHDGVTYFGKHTGGSFTTGQGITTRNFNTWECHWMYPPSAKLKENT